MLGLGLGLNKTARIIRPKNEVQYNPATWAEWTMVGVISADTTGVAISTSVSEGTITINTNLKLDTKYGLLYEIVENTTTSTFYAQLGSNHGGFGFPIDAGLQKSTSSTPATITNNYVRIGRNAQVTGYIKVKDIRLFELPTGSQIEWDFANLTAAQLNAKYPF
jgi:hypothetical protein